MVILFADEVVILDDSFDDRIEVLSILELGNRTFRMEYALDVVLFDFTLSVAILMKSVFSQAAST